MSEFSIVEYYGSNGANRCGYCKSENSSISYGLWAHSLAPQNYQDCITRGWRRSGKYCYKPVMNKTCCPLYTIRCPVSEFKLSKSQKKVLKKMHKFLAFGKTRLKEDESGSNQSIDMEDMSENIADIPKNLLHNTNKHLESIDIDSSQFPSTSAPSAKSSETKVDSPTGPPKSRDNEPKSKELKGPDSTKPPCQKAKFLRREKRNQKLKQKLQKEGVADDEVEKILKEANQTNINIKVKTLEDHLSEPLPENPAHTLEVKLISSHPKSSSFENSFKASYNCFKEYQMTIHNESEYQQSENKFSRFLVNSPIRKESNAMTSLPMGFGSFHQHYILDGELIAVGVIDLLPSGLSSVYLYYNPKYSFLSLGTYAALREIAYTRELQKLHSSFQYYYMGYYIHSCPKMRYKGQYSPSFLLCPDTYTWHPIEACIPKLNQNKYCRLNEDPLAEDEDENFDEGKSLILFQKQLISLEIYKRLARIKNTELNTVKEYCHLVGKRNSYSMLLYRD